MKKLLVLILLLTPFTAQAQIFNPPTVLVDSFVNPCSYSPPFNGDTVAAAYSLRKVNPTYTGYAVRVRRESDNTTQDIGFSTCDFDSSALATFCASTTCRATIWYEQTGGYNATQSDTSKQPAVYDNCENGESCIFFDRGRGDHMDATLSQGLTGATMAGVVLYYSTNASRYVASTGNGSTSGVNLSADNGTTCRAIRVNGANYEDATKSSCFTNDTFFALAGHFTDNLSQVRKNNVAGTDATDALSIPSTTQITLGDYGGASHHGHIAEMIYFRGRISDVHYTTLYNNQAAYWNIP